jgi:CubicO group peptidase (beta-lactamase class C family)
VDELLTQRNARQLIFSPGEDWEYSNIGYLFVRQLIERTTGEDIDSSLRRLVFEPLGITKTRIAMAPSDMAQTRWGNPGGYDPRWVFHGLLIGPPMDAVHFLEGLMMGRIISRPMLATMCSGRVLGGSVPGRPWTQIGYGLGLMIGNMNGAGRVFGHSGVGHDTVSALYAFLDLPGRPIVAAFAQGTNEGVPENEAVRLALAA